MKTTTNPTTATYNVSVGTTLLLNCIREATALYSHIAEAMDALYNSPDIPVDIGAQEAAPYLQHVNAITDMLHVAVQEQITDNLSNTDNAARSAGITI